MLDADILALTGRIALRRALASPAAVAAGLAFPAFIVWVGLAQSYAAAEKLFFFLLPHAFLVAAQDMARSDIESGVLENVLFAGGRFRGYLAAKAPVVAAAAAAYAAALFGLFAAWGLARGAFGPGHLVRFGTALLAGLYYVALAGLLGFFLRGGANVLALLLAQSAVLLALLLTVSARTGILDYAATGRFPGAGAKALFAGLAAVLPNVIVSARPTAFAAVVAIGLGFLGLLQWRLVRGLELGARRGS